MAQVPAEASELSAILRAQAEANSRERKKAIACFLSGDAGWKEALNRLDGAFASERATERPEDA